MGANFVPEKVLAAVLNRRRYVERAEARSSGVKDISLSSGLVDSHRVGEITTARYGASNLSELRSVALAD